MLTRPGKRRIVSLLLAGVAGISAAQSQTPTPICVAGGTSAASAARDLQPPAGRMPAQPGYVWNKSRS